MEEDSSEAAPVLLLDVGKKHPVESYWRVDVVLVEAAHSCSKCELASLQTGN